MNAIAQSGGTEEPVATGSVSYVWGKDLSGAWQGAGGVGGLLAVRRDGAWFFSLYDNNGNITEYVDENGAVVAHYAYDAFGRALAQSGSLADSFAHRFSTKYYDAETGLYDYGYRYYAPELMRWICRDPIEEGGGENLYAVCKNCVLHKFDSFGLVSYNTLSANYPLPTSYPVEINKTNNIWKLVGGKVLENAQAGSFKNSCAIRLSHTLNKSGEIIPYIAGKTSSGINPPKWWYIYRVKQMKIYLTGKYGNPVVYKSREKFTKCAPKGILLLEVTGWRDASGHVTLWDGKKTIDDKDDYFERPNPVFNLWGFK